MVAQCKYSTIIVTIIRILKKSETTNIKGSHSVM